MIRAVTFDKQLLKSEDFSHQVNYFYQGKMGITRGCEMSTDVNGDIVISDGYFSIYGRLIRNLGDTIIDVPTVSSGILYSILVFEVDLGKENTIDTFNQGAFKILSNSSTYPTLTKENIDNGGTIYQMEFCRFESDVSGITNLVDTRTILNLEMYAMKDYVDDNISRPNLLRNSSFEYGNFGDTSYWYAVTSTGSGIQAFSDVALSGNRSMKISSLDSNFEGSIRTEGSTDKAYLIPKKYTKYVLSAYVKTNNVVGDGASLTFNIITKYGGTVYTYSSVPITGTNDWIRIKLEFATSLVTQIGQVQLKLKGKGEVYFDNVKLEEGITSSPWCISDYDSVTSKEIVESGSNVNGKYVKYNDGTMICYGTRDFSAVPITSPVGSLYYSTGDKTNIGAYPSTFISNDIAVSFDVSSNNNYIVWLAQATKSTTTNAPQINVMRPSAMTVDIHISFTAIGRWF